MKNGLFKGLMIVFEIILVLAVFANIYALTGTGLELYETLTYAGLIATATFGGIYIFTEYSKTKSAGFYKIFMFLYAATELIGVLGAKSDSVNTAETMLLVIAFGCALVLAIAKDLGIVNSVVLSSLITYSAITRIIISEEGFGIALASKLILGVTVLVLVIAKYYDKAKRYKKAEEAAVQAENKSEETAEEVAEENKTEE